jgi:glycosyl transferase family 25
MKAYCINMDWCPVRLIHMEQQFARLGRTFERIPGVEGTDPDIMEAAANSPKGLTGLQLSAGVYANFQSHRVAWQRLVDSGDSHAMVMEDDLILSDGFEVYLDDGWVPESADIIRLETFLHRAHLARSPTFSAGTRKLMRLRSRHAGLACYVLSARIAPFLLEQTKVVSDPSDEALFNERLPLFHQIVTYQMVPAPALQGNLMDDGPDKPKWAVSTISERFADGNSPETDLRETQLARLKRRVSEEIRALRENTRYVVVPFG